VIHGIDETSDHQLFIVMGYYEGETLSQKLARGTLSVRDSLHLAIQVARGLSAAHARNIVHRDIKPSNIIVSKDNVAKVVDFGLARVVATASATLSSSTTGTLPYMAPEQILGEAVDQRCDVWPLGIMLTQMLTGSHPFLRPNTTAMTFAILNQPPAGLEALPPAIQPVVYRALSKQSEHRYANAGEMLRDLEAVRAEITSTPLPREEPTVTRAVTADQLKELVENASTPRWTTAHPGPKQRRTLTIAGALLAAAVIAALLLPPVRARLSRLISSGNLKHIAVLPFDNIGNDPANEVVAAGLMDSLTSKLSDLDATQQSLWVVPASVVRGSGVSEPGAAFRDLGATLVVKGSIQRAQKDVRVTVNLIDAQNLRQVGSVALEDATGDLAALENEAVARLARLMNLSVTADMLRDAGGSVAPAAYESYLKALGYMQRYDKPGNLDLAVAALESAAQTDPRFALAYAELGETFRLKNQVDPNPKWIEEASRNLERAAQLDDRLPATYISLGQLHSSLTQYDLALEEFQKALQINPRDPDALSGIAGLYEHMGRLADAEATYKRAISLRPDYWDGYNSLGNFYDRQGRYQDAIAQYRRVIQLTPDNATTYSNLASEYASVGDAASNAAAEAAFMKSIQLAPTYAAYANLGNLYMGEQRYGDAAKATRKALDLNDKDYRVWVNLLLDERSLKDETQSKLAREKALSLLTPYIVGHQQDAIAQSWLGMFLAEDGDREKAVARFDTALALFPKDPLVLCNAAEAYQDLGDRTLALKYAHETLKYGFGMGDLQSRPGLQSLLTDASFRSGGSK
jgi:eukaryotic-like serine/threonine-protein kinase